MYLEKGTYHTRLFRRPSTNDMKMKDSKMVLAGPSFREPIRSPPWGERAKRSEGVCVFITDQLQYLLQSCSRGRRGIVEDMCYERRRAEACVD